MSSLSTSVTMSLLLTYLPRPRSTGGILPEGCGAPGLAAGRSSGLVARWSGSVAARWSGSVAARSSGLATALSSASAMATGSSCRTWRGVATRGGRARGTLRGLAEEDLADVGPAEDLAGRPGNLDPSPDQDVGPVGHAECLECLLLDQQHGRPRVGEPPDLVPEHRPGHFRGEVGGRLVEHEHRRFEHQHPRHREHLPFAAAELARRAGSGLRERGERG